jgi:hypothetical protein
MNGLFESTFYFVFLLPLKTKVNGTGRGENRSLQEGGVVEVLSSSFTAQVLDENSRQGEGVFFLYIFTHIFLLTQIK